jgi:MFS family permease
VWDLERVRYVAANYERLQGLRKLPIGVLLVSLVAALVLARAWTPEDAVVPAVYVYVVLGLIVMFFVGAFFLYYSISAYYERKYGSVEHFRRVPLRRKLLSGALVLAVILSTSFGLLLLGVAALIVYWSERHFRSHYVIMAALMIGYGTFHMLALIAGLTIIPGLWTVAWKLYELGRLITLTTVGLYLIVGGILDHRLLVRTMKRLPEEDGRAV